MDDLAEQLGHDPLEFRLANAIRAGDRTPSGQRLAASAGLAACLEALRPHWERLREAAAPTTPPPSGGAATGRRHRGHVVRHRQHRARQPLDDRDGRDPRRPSVLLCGAVDIGQGASTILVQIAADALGVQADAVGLVSGDTDRTADAGKSSASRQTFVSGNAARLAGEDLRRQILQLAEVEDGTISIEAGSRGRPRPDRRHGRRGPSRSRSSSPSWRPSP